MLLTTTNFIDGKELEILGLVYGSTVQSKHVGRDIGAGFKTLVGGELKGYTEMLDDARRIAVDRIKEDAKKIGADAIVNILFNSSAIVPGASEILVYGTAVKYKS
ncbi:hypothetical protein AN640_05090 [Candidatus Epulonipiscium fishelsonii]|uniref:Uncharacterized protein n=1 Tax=Candidatus Epulonipiscium fishelsonii TaxID=77094 RepID=A0ACC8XIK8_9FIRM|nr:hypothetical protein AN640_05090 [Epulopiscium sp. SCG-D08WGA-EpuloA1]